VPPAYAYSQQAFHTGWTNHGHNLTERFLRAADAVALAPAQHSPIPSPARLEELEQKLGHLFTHRKLLFLALTHPSACAQGSPNSKELSWMGDSALNLAITEQLAGSDIESVGKLTEARAQLASRSNCAKSAEVFGLEEIMIIGKGVLTSNGGPTDDMLGMYGFICSVACRLRFTGVDSIYLYMSLTRSPGEAMEAVFGAVYVDGGMDAVRKAYGTLVWRGQNALSWIVNYPRRAALASTGRNFPLEVR